MDEIYWPRRADEPHRRAEYARVSMGREAAAVEYALGVRHWQRMIDALPDAVRRTLAADPYGPPVVPWDDVAPYVDSARDAASEWDGWYSPVAAEFLRRVDWWYPDRAAKANDRGDHGHS
jgi:hypothetical protein